MPEGFSLVPAALLELPLTVLLPRAGVGLRGTPGARIVAVLAPVRRSWPATPLVVPAALAILRAIELRDLLVGERPIQLVTQRVEAGSARGARSTSEFRPASARARRFASPAKGAAAAAVGAISIWS